MTTPQHATILFGHGSRDPLWHQPMQAVARQASQLAPHTLVRCAYLELTEPDLPACVQELAAAGVTDIAITPMFLGVGRHAREDLPRLFDELRTQYPHIRFQLSASVGEDARVIELLARIAVSPD
jgi:sirohydrochlorin cobaltochelatase